MYSDDMSIFWADFLSSFDGLICPWTISIISSDKKLYCKWEYDIWHYRIWIYRKHFLCLICMQRYCNRYNKLDYIWIYSLLFADYIKRIIVKYYCNSHLHKLIYFSLDNSSYSCYNDNNLSGWRRELWLYQRIILEKRIVLHIVMF